LKWVVLICAYLHFVKSFIGLLIAGLAMALNVNLHAQSPYRISKADAFFAPGMALLGGYGMVIQSEVTPLNAPTIAAMELDDIPRIDRSRWVGGWEHWAVNLSDVSVVVACAAPMALFTGRFERSEFWKIALLGTEAGLTAFAAVNITKGLALRPRPFVYGSAAPSVEYSKPAARFSFFSGHTALTAAAGFFGAKLYHDYHPSSKVRALVWAVAAAAPVGMGLLRMRAGKHFLTDVATGYVVGAASGFFVPWLHRDGRAAKLSVLPVMGGGGGVLVNWSF
jgi:membrane-associated phospholipid phosphatase